MEVQLVIGELLYIGFVAEKGRCYKRWWSCRYKKTLKNHISALITLNSLLLDYENVNKVLQDFVELCKSDNEIGKFYHFSQDIENVIWRYDGNNYEQINCLMKEILEELSKELNRKFVNKKRVYTFLRILHNLPCVYLGKDKRSLCNLQHIAISERDALLYAYQNMGIEEKQRYNRYFNDIVN